MRQQVPERGGYIKGACMRDSNSSLPCVFRIAHKKWRHACCRSQRDLTIAGFILFAARRRQKERPCLRGGALWICYITEYHSGAFLLSPLSSNLKRATLLALTPLVRFPNRFQISGQTFIDPMFFCVCGKKNIKRKIYAFYQSAVQTAA